MPSTAERYDVEAIRLISPASEHERDALAFAEQVMQADGDGIHGSCDLYNTRPFALWLDRVNRLTSGEGVDGLVPCDTLFGVRPSDGAIVGIINVRYGLESDFMRNYGGHIGYTVRPCERRKGYAAQMLRLALDRCRARGMTRVLLTCDPVNAGSERVIVSCGGVFENEIPYEDTDELVRRYWIEL